MLKNLREKISANKALCSSIKRVIVLDKIDSTNSYAQSLDNPNDSTVIIANCQTKGRGRDNREWKSFEEKNISISIILDYPRDNNHLGLLSILSANSIVEALEELNIKPQVKWPNDVLVGQKKSQEYYQNPHLKITNQHLSLLVLVSMLIVLQMILVWIILNTV